MRSRRQNRKYDFAEEDRVMRVSVETRIQTWACYYFDLKAELRSFKCEVLIRPCA